MNSKTEVVDNEVLPYRSRINLLKTMTLAAVMAVCATESLSVLASDQQQISAEERARVQKVDPPIHPDPVGNGLLGGAAGGLVGGGLAGAAAGAARSATVGTVIQAGVNALKGAKAPEPPVSTPPAGRATPPTPAPAPTRAPTQRDPSGRGLGGGGASRGGGGGWAGADHASSVASHTA
jgi:hypothetical protein